MPIAEGGKFTVCACCGHQTSAPAAATEPMTRYYAKVRRDIATGAQICPECDRCAVPSGQPDMFIKGPA